MTTTKEQPKKIKVKLPELEMDAKLWQAFQELTYKRDDVIAEVAACFIESSIRSFQEDPDFKARLENDIDIDIGKWAQAREDEHERVIKEAVASRKKKAVSKKKKKGRSK